MVTEQFKGQANSVEALEAKHSTLEKTLSESTKLQDTLQDALENAQKNYEKKQALLYQDTKNSLLVQEKL